MSGSKALPWEVWEKIISRINDPKKLVELRQVCSLFNQVIELEMGKNQKWEKLFPSDMRMWTNNIMFKRFSFARPSKLLSSPNLWKEIFWSYKNWRRFADKSRKLLRISSDVDPVVDKKITCVAVFARYIAVGTDLGLIFFYKIGQSNNTFWLINQGGHVTNIQFWYCGKNNLLAVAISKDKTLKLWNVSQKTRIAVSQIKATNIHVGINHRLFVELFCVITEYNYTSNGIVPKAQCVVCRSSNGPKNKFLTMHSEEEILIVMTTFDEYLRITTLKLPGPKEILLTESGYKSYRFLPRRPPIDLALIPNRSFKIFKNGKFLTIVNEDYPTWRVMDHELFPNEDKFVTSIASHVHLLIFGLHTGFIYIYAFKSNYELMENSFDSINVRKIKVDSRPIIALALTETKKRKYIIAATELNFHHIYLNDKKESGVQ